MVAAWFIPRVGDELVPDEGEYIVDEVRHHWIVFVPRVLELVLAVGLVVLDGVRGVPHLVVLPAAALLARCVAKVLLDHMDRFVITNFRVFRVHGFLDRQTATMPLSRILDITVTTPLLGRVLEYGHFVFESAAQAQGLRDIRYIGHPHERDLTMQRVIQRAGLRRNATSVSREVVVREVSGPNPSKSRPSGPPPSGPPPSGPQSAGPQSAGPHPSRTGRGAGTSRRRRVGFGG